MGNKRNDFDYTSRKESLEQVKKTRKLYVVSGWE